MDKLREHPTYRGAMPHAVGADHHLQRRLRQGAPATRRTAAGTGEPFAPGANPMHGRDRTAGWRRGLSVAQACPTDDAQDGISLHALGRPGRPLGRRPRPRARTCRRCSTRYFGSGGFHMNVNVLEPRDAAATRWSTRSKYPQLDDPGLGLRGELRPADARAAAGRHQPHLPCDPI
ncbi:MAG: hypothetical protein MZW92_74730 [Comamonadaceae bacterium]|nr:hypothetical protein [Comamonadaceae bacterium]